VCKIYSHGRASCSANTFEKEENKNEMMHARLNIKAIDAYNEMNED
jgi:hypothetical protein